MNRHRKSHKTWVGDRSQLQGIHEGIGGIYWLHVYIYVHDPVNHMYLQGRGLGLFKEREPWIFMMPAYF